MATYYVRPDGNNSNTGTGQSAGQAWSTVVYALANMALPDATNTLYIAPGTYRGAVTMSITPSVSNTLVVAGDPTASQFTGINAGRVRLTSFPTDNTSTPTSGQTLTCDNKTYFTLRNLHVEGYQTTAGQGIAHFLNAKNYTVEKCLFTLYRRGTGSSCVFVTTTTTTAVNATFDKCVIVNGYTGLNIQSPSTGSTFDLAISVKNTIVTFANNAVIVSNPAEGAGVGNGVTFYNCILQGNATLYLRTTNTTNKTFFYNNAIVAFASIGLDATSNAVTEDYNRFSCFTDRSGTIGGGTNSQSGVLGLDFLYSRISGLYPLDFSSTYNGSPAQNTGSLVGAPTVDIFGDAWTSTNPDVGAATFKLSSATSQYYPTERNASTITIAPASTSQSIELYLGAIGLTASTSGLSARYNRTRTASVSIPLVARTIAQAWTSGGFAEVDATNMPGVYRIDLPDAALAAGADDVTIVVRGASGTNGAVMTVKLSSGGLTSAQTASAVWDAATVGYNTATNFGGVIMETNGVVNGIESTVQDIPGNVWDELKANHTIPNTFGDYLDTKVSTGADTARIQLRQGPFLIKQNAIDSVITEVNQFLSTVPNIEMVLIDSSGGSVSVAGSTLVMRVRNQAGTAVVNNITPTVAYADGGVIRWSPNLSWNALTVTTAGTYRIVVERTMSGVTTTFGPFLVQLSSG